MKDLDDAMNELRELIDSTFVNDHYSFIRCEKLDALLVSTLADV